MRLSPSWPEREKFARRSGETLDVLFDGGLTLLQSRLGYRFSVDALLLAHFVSIRRNDKIVDLGSGNGVASLTLARLYPSAMVTGVELQESMVERARRNICLNGLEERIQIVRGDVRSRQRLLSAGSFDAAVCNPPYRKPSSGRISAHDERRVARHELNGDLSDFLGAAAFSLRNRGRAAIVHLAARSADVIVAMRQAGLEPKRLRMVHSFHGAEASLVLVEGVRGGRAGLAVLPPLTIYRRAKEYTVEVAAILSGVRA